MKLNLDIRCSFCSKQMTIVDPPKGHGDHAHVRCDECSPAGFVACVTVYINPMPRNGISAEPD